MSYTEQDAVAAGWSITQRDPGGEDPNSGVVTPPRFRAERLLNDSTLGEVADSMDLLLMRIELFEQQLARNGGGAH